MKKYELHKNGNCLFVGNKEDCDKAKLLLVAHYRYGQATNPLIDVQEQHLEGSEQAYIEKVLDPKNDFEYGH